MKKIFLALAAVAALASCVKENTLVPEQTADNLVTITAVSADTKTTLDDVNVLWEENDEIAVVVEGELNKYMQTFTTSSTEKASTAEFTAVLSDELAADETVTGVGYAVYPAESVTYEHGIVSIAHVLPEAQTGTITKGMNLSYAKVDADDIKEGKANAVFSNALTLLKVNVPAGVKSVVLESDIMSPALVGTVNFTVNKTADNISFVKGGAVSTKRTVTLSNGGAELEEGVHDLLVFPGIANELTLTMTGTDDAVYENTLTEVEFVAGTYRTINLTNVFKMGVKDVEAVSPMGGPFEVEVVATVENEYEVIIEDTKTWIQYVQTKAFNGKTIEFNVDPNTSTSSREADITITWDGGSRNFTVVQEGKAELSFVYVNPEDPESGLIQWEEKFGFYDSNENALASYTNVFTISLAEGDELTYGTYKIENMLKAFFYYGKGFQQVNGQGGVYYANYDAVNKKLIVSMNGATKSYDNMSDITLIYDDDNNTFSAEKFAATAVRLSGTSSPTSGYIVGYTVKVKEDDPGAGDSPYAYLFGEYTENFADGSYYGNPAKGVLTIAESDDANYHLKMTFFGGTSAAVTVYATVAGNTITTVQPAGYTNMGTFYASTLTVSGSTISGTLKFDYPTVPDYTATKQ